MDAVQQLGGFVQADPQAAMDAMADALIRKYAPLPAGSLSTLVSMLGNAAHQWASLHKATLARAKARLAPTSVDGVGSMSWALSTGDRVRHCLQGRWTLSWPRWPLSANSDDPLIQSHDCPVVTNDNTCRL